MPPEKKLLKPKNKSKKSTYGDPSAKIKAGEPWVYSLKLDPDNQASILEEKEKSKKSPYDKGTDFLILINARIRRGYRK